MCQCLNEFEGLISLSGLIEFEYSLIGFEWFDRICERLISSFVSPRFQRGFVSKAFGTLSVADAFLQHPRHSRGRTGKG